jgi:hypothetical protein
VARPRPGDIEVPPVQGGDPDSAVPFGQGDYGGVGAAQGQAGVGGDWFADPFPVGAVGCGDQWPSIDDQHLVAPEPLIQHLVGLGR